MYDDRIEITNPGGLYGRMRVDELGKTQPETRNPNIVRVMEDFKETENRYSGIPIIRSEMERYGLAQPEFIDTKNAFTIILRNCVKKNKHNTETYNKIQLDLMGFCKVPKTKEELCNHLNIKTFSYIFQKYIREMVENEDIMLEIPERRNSPKQRYYTV